MRLLNILVKVLFIGFVFFCSGCMFIYNEKAYKENQTYGKNANCNYEVIINVLEDDDDNPNTPKKRRAQKYLSSRPYTVILTTSVNKLWIWPWPPTIPYHRSDFAENVCKTGADAIIVKKGVGAPNYRFARIELIKWK